MINVCFRSFPKGAVGKTKQIVPQLPFFQKYIFFQKYDMATVHVYFFQTGYMPRVVVLKCSSVDPKHDNSKKN